ADVTILRDESFDERILRLVILLVRRVRELLIYSLHDVFGVLRILDLDVVPAGESLSAQAVLIEIVVSEEERRRVDFFGRAGLNRDEIERPGIAAALRRHVRRLDRNLVADFPAEGVGELLAGDCAGARLQPLPLALCRNDVLRINIEELGRLDGDLPEGTFVVLV